MFKNGVTEEQIIAGMRDDFLADATERLALLRKSLEAARNRDCENNPLKTFRAEVHTLKGMGQAFGFPSLTLISRRLEGYLRAHTEEAFSDDDEVDLFLECIADVVTAGEEPADDLLETILESLPAPVCD
jgi:chemotaxis protein histidine kinase CheA